SVMRFERAGRAWRRRVRCLRLGAERVGDTRDCNTPGPEQHRDASGKVNDGRLDADLARAPVEDQIDVRTEILVHVLRGGRADAAEPVGRRCSDAAAEFPQQSQRDRMAGYAKPYRVLASGELVSHSLRAQKYEGERSGPESLRERRRVPGNLARPARQLRGVP